MKLFVNVLASKGLIRTKKVTYESKTLAQYIKYRKRDKLLLNLDGGHPANE